MHTSVVVSYLWVAFSNPCMYAEAYFHVPCVVCSQLWVGVSQTAKRPAGKFPISQCSVQRRLTTKGSEIHSCTTARLSPRVSFSFLPFSLCPPLFLTLSSTTPPALSVSPDESEQRWKAFGNAGRQAVLYSNLTWGRWKPAGKLGIEREGWKVRGSGGQGRDFGKERSRRAKQREGEQKSE